MTGVRRLVLVAASGLAREVLASGALAGSYDEVVVVDDDPTAWETEIGGAPVLGPIDLASDPGAGDVLICAGRGVVRRRLVGRLALLGVGPDRYATVVAPDAMVPDGCTVGDGSILLSGVVLTADVHVGRHVVLMPQVVLTHDDVVDDYATLAAGVTLGGGVHVGEGAYLGMHASVRERLRVGRASMLGMGSVLLQDLPDAETWVGVPAGPLADLGPAVPAARR